MAVYANPPPKDFHRTATSYAGVYTGTMFRGPHKLLIALLVLLLGIGPIGSVIAGAHACAPGFVQSSVTDSAGHHDHTQTMGADGVHVDRPSSTQCNGCDNDCCKGGLCKMGQCAGTTAALNASVALVFEHFVSNETRLTAERPLAGRPTPPFRPPQS